MKSLLFSALLLYVGFGLYLYAGQRSFIYFPVSAIKRDLSQQVFENDGHSIRAAVLNQGKSKAILYFGGNAESVDYNAVPFASLFHDFTVYLVNYRGYGGSSGSPSERAFYADAIHIYDVVSPEYDAVSLVGRSLGSAVATYVAATRSVERQIGRAHV